MSNKFNLRFFREELSHVEYTMDIKDTDVELIATMDDQQLDHWVNDVTYDEKYADDRPEFYDWMSGKEYPEGEGNRGTFDFRIEIYPENYGSREAEIKIGSDDPVVDYIYIARPEVDYNNFANAARATWAGIALDAFVEVTRTDDEDKLADLLCDLMHWADFHDASFRRELHRAVAHYEAECKTDE
jgi:hypothetical protein